MTAPAANSPVTTAPAREDHAGERAFRAASFEDVHLQDEHGRRVLEHELRSDEQR
jgi:hypothetical protein